MSVIFAHRLATPSASGQELFAHDVSTDPPTSCLSPSAEQGTVRCRSWLTCDRSWCAPSRQRASNTGRRSCRSIGRLRTPGTDNDGQERPRGRSSLAPYFASRCDRAATVRKGRLTTTGACRPFRVDRGRRSTRSKGGPVSSSGLAAKPETQQPPRRAVAVRVWGQSWSTIEASRIEASRWMAVSGSVRGKLIGPCAAGSLISVQRSGVERGTRPRIRKRTARAISRPAGTARPGCPTDPRSRPACRPVR